MRSLKIFLVLLVTLALMGFMGSSSVLIASHVTHFASDKGPGLDANESGCVTCHAAGNLQCDPSGPLFRNVEDPEGPAQSLAQTGVCDNCHSPGGAFDGVNDPQIGAKANWNGGVYEADGTILKAGKEKWCAGCHDWQLGEPDSKAEVNGVAAPSVIADNTTYGFYVTGHGRDSAGLKCEDCHDVTLPHIDGEHRTYEVDETHSPVQVIHPYTESYRLNKPLIVPRQAQSNDDGAFELCTSSCHHYNHLTATVCENCHNPIPSQTHSNFRSPFMEHDDPCPGPVQNWHGYHLKPEHEFFCGDSDFDGSADSSQTCILCHNVHGAPNSAMIRHGELISTPGTFDKVPAFDFKWYKGECNADLVVGEQTSYFKASRWGSMVVGKPQELSVNNVCVGCHRIEPTNEESKIQYYRKPVGLVDDFEGYDSHNELRAVWQRYQDAYPPYLAPSYGPDGSKCMAVKVVWAVAPGDYGAVIRDIDPIDLTNMKDIGFWLKVNDTSKINQIGVRLRRTSDNQWSTVRFSTSSLQNGVWTWGTLSKDSFSLPFSEVNGIAFGAFESDPSQSYESWVFFDGIHFTLPKP